MEETEAALAAARGGRKGREDGVRGLRRGEERGGAPRAGPAWAMRPSATRGHVPKWGALVWQKNLLP